MPPEQTRNETTQSGDQAAAALTPELVKEVAEKVYALMLKDLKISQERSRGGKGSADHKGRRK